MLVTRDRLRVGFTLAEIIVSLAVLALAAVVGLQALRGPSMPDAAEAIEDLPLAVEALRSALQADVVAAEGTARVCWLEYADNGPLWRVSREGEHISAASGLFVYAAHLKPEPSEMGTAQRLHVEVTPLPAAGVEEAVESALARAEGLKPELRTSFLIRR